MVRICYRLFALSLVIQLLAGCAISKQNLADTGEYYVQVVPGTAARITKTNVYREEGMLLVSGKVEKLKFYLPGKVQIVILGPDGDVLEEASPAITNYASQRGGMKSARFSARFSPIPPEGSTVRLQYIAAGSQQEKALGKSR